jgi:membrane protease YdiL (CAAX protease family)
MRRPGGPAPLVLTVAVLAVTNLLSNRLVPGAALTVGLVAAATCLVLARWDGASWADLGLGRGTLRRGLRWAGASALVVLAVYALGLALPPTREAFLDRRADLPTDTLLYHALVRVPLGTVLVEEVGFRGALLAMGLRRWGRRTGVLVSSALFGLWHLLPASGVRLANPAVADVFNGGALASLGWTTVAVLGSAFAGVVLCELRLRSGSLLAPMGAHWATNGLAYLGAALARGVTPRAG